MFMQNFLIVLNKFVVSEAVHLTETSLLCDGDGEQDSIFFLVMVGWRTPTNNYPQEASTLSDRCRYQR
jgi:hypothetical protein